MNIAKSTDQFVFMIKSYEYLGPRGNISILLYSTKGRQWVDKWYCLTIQYEIDSNISQYNSNSVVPFLQGHHHLKDTHLIRPDFRCTT